jgi:uncharacterized protein YjeT (DUF2065 family)
MTPDAKPTAGRVRRASFWIVIGLATLFLLLTQAAAYPLLFTNWLPTDAWLAVRSDRSAGDQVHRLHSLALGVIVWGMLAGVALQFHRPSGKVAALLMSLAAVVAVACGLSVTGTSFTGIATGMAPFLLPILAAGALHPSAEAFLRLPRVDLRMFALSLIAAGPSIAYAVAVSGAAREAGPDVYIEHLAFMATVALLILLWGLIGATDKPGWAFPAGAAVLASACLGLQSLMFPDVLSGLDPLWAGAAVAWCIAYGAAAWYRSRRA